MNPFYFETTCERIQPIGLIQQPISTTINLLTVVGLIIIVFAHLPILKKQPLLIVILASFIAFEIWHCISHARHGWIPKETQINITHGLFYGVILSLFAFAYKKQFLHSWSIGMFAFLVAMDLLVWIFVRGTWMIVSGVFVAFYLMLIMIPFFSKSYIIAISALIFLSMILVSVESKLCPLMFGFPLHILTEICVMMIFVLTALLLVQSS